jgi:hypothetical protein
VLRPRQARRQLETKAPTENWESILSPPNIIVFGIVSGIQLHVCDFEAGQMLKLDCQHASDNLKLSTMVIEPSVLLLVEITGFMVY